MRWLSGDCLRVARGAVVWLGARRVMGDLVGGESRVVGENIAQNRICAKLVGTGQKG